MVSKTWKAMLVGAIAGVMTMAASAQDSKQVSETDSGGAVAGMAAERTRSITISRFSLGDPALRLSSAQTTQIDKIVSAYAAAQAVGNSKISIEKGDRPSEADISKQQSSLTSLIESIGNVMTSEQRKSWEATQGMRRYANSRARSRGAASQATN